MTLTEANDVHEIVVKKGYSAALDFVLSLDRKAPQRLIEHQAKTVLTGMFYSLLHNGNYTLCALIAWGSKQFNPEPQEVQRIWRAMQQHAVNFILGASSLGKSYTPSIFILLDYSRDPEYTSWKIISTSEEHCRANVWSTITSFHNSSIIQLPGTAGAEFVRLKTTDMRNAIQIVGIPQGDDGKGRLQGFHPLPRPVDHPAFGPLSRVGIYLDEAEKIPPGVWEGWDNAFSAQTPRKSVRGCAVTNPADISSTFAQRSEPSKGWIDVDEDEDFEWESKFGYHITRLDAKYSANVVAQKEIFVGMQTYEGYMALEKQGPSSPSYWTFGRGLYPRQNIEYVIIPPAYLEDVKKNFIWEALPENVAAFDAAFAEGGAKPCLTTGRAGMAIGVEGGPMFPEPIFVGQVDQQFEIEKQNAFKMALNLIDICRDLHVRPEWLACDKTGPGLAFYDTLRIKFGDVLGIGWAEEATDLVIVSGNSLKANERFKGIISEMWFSLAAWLEYRHLLFSPTMDTRVLFTQLTARKWKPGYKVESKREYRARTKAPSCDESDSLAMFLQIIRARGKGQPSAVPPTPPPRDNFFGRPLPDRLGRGDRINFINMRP